VQRVKQVCVLLPNKGGELAKLCRVLAGARVNIVGLSVVESSEHGIIRMVVDNPSSAVRAIEENSMLCTQSEVLVVGMPDEVGAMAKVADRLAAARVNINYVYGSTGSPGQPAQVMVAVDDIAAAEKALAGM